MLVGLLCCGLSRDARGQAEEAPASYEPPPGVPISVDPRRVAAEREAQRRLWIISLSPRFVVALGDGGGAEIARLGWGVGLSVGRALLIAGHSRLGLGGTFAYEQEQREHLPPARLANGDVTQRLGHAAFSLDLRLEGLYLEHAALRPWVTMGPAISIGTFSDPPSTGNPDGISYVAALGGLRAACGVAYEIQRIVELGLRAEVLATFGGPEVGTPPTHPFTPGNFSLGLDVGYRF